MIQTDSDIWSLGRSHTKSNRRPRLTFQSTPATLVLLESWLWWVFQEQQQE